MIPKIIHYCWFGGNEKSALINKCIDSWKRYFPDYDIKEWNESNFDVRCNTYVSQAYEAKKWAFVSDYARFYILEKEGGLYFDTDVEVIRSFEHLLGNAPFTAFETDEYVNPGLILYSPAPHNEIFRKTLDWYNSASFMDENGEPIPHTVCTVFTDILKEYGFKSGGQEQVCGGMILYSKDYFNPYDDATGRMMKTENTYTIHWYAKSWISPWMRIRSKITQVFHRIFGVDCFRRLKKM